MSTGSLDLWLATAMCVAPVGVVALIILTAGVFQRRRERLLATTGRRAIGRVLALGYDSDGLGGDTYWVKVQYDHDDQTLTSNVTVSYRDRQRYPVGQRIGLTYATGRPHVVRLDPPEWALRQAS